MKNQFTELTNEQLQKIYGGTPIQDANNENDLNRGSGRP
ncbi:ComC/BlpC family leader-containing pheromone/bacteriocin [Flavobacterium sp. GCM10027622]